MDLLDPNPSPEVFKNLLTNFSPNIRDHFPFPTIRPSQELGLQAIERAYASDKKFIILELPTGVGKCLAKGTLVLMFDGSTREIEKVKVGELVMGPDSRPRRVLSLSSGESEMFIVRPDKGEAYTVNENHILSLRHSGRVVREHQKYLDKENVCEISLQEYVGKSKWFKHCFKGFKTGVEFVNRPVPLSPYFIGLWLGDGNSRWPTVTTSDKEITTFLEGFAKSYDLFLTQDDVASVGPTGIITYSWNISSKNHGGSQRQKQRQNPVLNRMRRLNILGNKHIPSSYLVNSRRKRLELLAGLLDSDGELVHNTYGIWSKWQQLANQICFLARSLGFASFVKPGIAKLDGKEFPGFRVTIYGKGLEQIPVLLKRKKATTRTQIKNALHTGITIVPAGRGEYFGFSLDVDGRFLLGDFTVTHNSGIAVAAASWAKTLPTTGEFQQGAYILSPQKTLTAQYMKDFANLGLLELKGKANYWCHQFETDCDTASLLHGGRDDEDAGDNRGNPDLCCEYKPAKKAFIAGLMGVTNFAYYLNETQYSGQLKNRQLLILDEGHNTEGQILGFTDTVINPKRSEEHGAGKLPFIKPGENAKTREWLVKTFVPATQEYMRNLEELMNEAKYAQNREDQIKYGRKLDSTDKFLCRLNRFINSEDPGNWLCWSDKDSNVLTIKPLTATLYADEVLFRKAKKILIMSATILDFNTFMRNLGIKREDAEILAVPSEFPVENRPIFYRPVGLMSHKYIDQTLPKMGAMVEKILDKYAKHKGITQTHSYRITKYLTDFLRGKPASKRILTHTGEIQGSRDLAVQKHLSSPDPTVLFSPSMTEGLDLKEDLARFGISCKVPYPYMDPYVKARMQRDPAWYEWLTALAIVQGTGRIVRSRTDKGHFYILDGSFEYFLTKNQKVLPKWWTDSIIW
jgi:Rad3-related DNA helicase